MSQATVEQVKALLARLGRDLLRVSATEFEEKAPSDLVTEHDRRIEAEIRTVLPTLWEGSVVVGEESGGETDLFTWWVDPIDGTTNFVHGWGRSALSVALWRGDEPILAVVHDPYREETFWAESGKGAWLEEQRLRVSPCSDLRGALLCTGFAPEPKAQWELCRRLAERSHGIRVSGCASLDFAYVACARCDAFLEMDLKAWDVAAGLLLVLEAGGVVTDYSGRVGGLASGNFVVSSEHLLSSLLREIESVGLR